MGSNAVIKGDIIFKSYLKTEEGAEIDGYIKGSKSKQDNVEEENKDIEEIIASPALGRPTLVKDNKKEAI